MADELTSEPAEFTAGDSVEWTITNDDYPASGGWTLYYNLVKSGTRIQFNSSASGDDHLIDLAPATTAAYAAGTYHYQAYFDDGTDRHTEREGKIIINPNFATQTTGYDDRSHVKKVLDALEAQIEGRATKEQADMVIGSEVVGMIPIHRLMEFYDKYKALYENELAADRLAQGLGNRRNIYARFSNV